MSIVNYVKTKNYVGRKNNEVLLLENCGWIEVVNLSALFGFTGRFGVRRMKRLQEGSYAGIDTHKWKSFKKILSHIGYESDWIVVDPFARNCPLGGEWSNDIRPDTSAHHHLDAIEFLRIVPSTIADLVIFDPPFSQSQAERRYDGEGVNLYAEPGIISGLMSHVHRILKSGGRVLKFGYNSSKHWPQLELEYIWLINFGGNRNDVIVSLWRQTQTTLGEWV